VAKDKKKKKDKKTGPARKTAASFKSLAQNPLVADVVAAALVATSAALRNPGKARQIAEQAGDELNALAKEGAERGSAMWQLALDVGRRAMDTLATDAAKPAKASRTAKPAKRAKTAKPAKSIKSPKRSTARTKAN
jgi:hypothetical protein